MIIPDDWSVTTLEQEAELIMGQSPASEVINVHGQGLPFLQGNAEFGTTYPRAQYWCSQPVKRSVKGDILISVRAPVGALNKADQGYCIGRGLAAIHFKTTQVDFGWYALQHEVHQFQRVSQGSTFEAINRTELGKLTFLRPTDIEQTKIAAILGSIDETIEQTQSLIAQIGRVRQALLANITTSLGGHTQRRQTEIGELPIHWNISSLGKVADLKNGINFSSSQKGSNGILTVDVVNMFVDDTVISDENLYRVNTTVEHEHLLEDGDLLFVRSSVKQQGIGWTTLFKPLNEAATFCGFIIRARLQEKSLIPLFVLYWLRSPNVRKWIVSNASHSAITNISQEVLSRIKIPTPPIPEQERIVAVLSKVDRAFSHEKLTLDALKRVKRGLMHELLTGRRRFVVSQPAIASN